MPSFLWPICQLHELYSRYIPAAPYLRAIKKSAGFPLRKAGTSLHRVGPSRKTSASAATPVIMFNLFAMVTIHLPAISLSA
jgi:hypothetical protein